MISKLKSLSFIRKPKELKNLTHVYTYSDLDLLEHLALKIKKLELDHNDQLILIGTQDHISQTINLAQLPSQVAVSSVVINPKSLNKLAGKLKALVTSRAKAIVIVNDEPKFVRDVVSHLLKDSNLSKTPIIFKISVARYHRATRQFNVLPQDIDFLDDNLDYDFFYQIYSKSLKKFRQKCQIKDAWDIYQCVYLTKRIKGDIIEVGSYKGHSGWLIEQFNHKLSRYKRQVFLCDTFDQFPNEKVGVDHGWSGSHRVNFQVVKKKFSHNRQVTLVKGDIRQTLPELKKKNWSFAFIDVDSYDATIFALKKIYPRLSKGGIILCEDYGESHCLGARMAVDTFFADKKTFSYFSFFSGCKAFFKL